MWLVDVNSVWQGRPADAVKGTDMALRLLARTKELLGDGTFWRADVLAMSEFETPCDPLSERAMYFSLAGAAARARWEMREPLADAEISPEHMRLIMNALFAVARDYRGEVGGWRFACAVLDGMTSALEEYRVAQLGELQMRKNAA
jgi:hypothetical protein